MRELKLFYRIFRNYKNGRVESAIKAFLLALGFRVPLNRHAGYVDLSICWLWDDGGDE